MAYFSALGGTGGTSATITVTYSEDFYGLTITATNGTTTLTKTATSSGTLVFDVSEGGTWVVSGTVEGATYSEQVDVFFEYTVPPLVALPDGSTALPINDIQMWLKCAGIRDKTTYTTLSDVLGDTETLIALCADSNACDYMARSTTWASGVAADSTAMLIVGKYNYCANKLLSNSTWSEALVNSTYWAYVFDVTVPKMTSNSAPSGLAFASSTYDSNYPAYKAFNGDSSNGWNARANPVFPEYLGYIFTQKIRLSEIALDTGGTRRVYTFKIQGSNDTTNGTDGTWADVSEVITTPDSGYNKTYPINGDGEYKAYRLYIVTGTTVTGNLNIATLQFYGRTDNANYIPLVPKMTSNTTPSGECTASTVYGTGYEAYRAFDNYTNGWCPNNSDSYGNAHITYEFDTAVVVNRWKVRNIDNNSSTSHNKVYKLRGSNTGDSDDWTDLSTTSALANVNQDYYLDFVNSTAYKYFDFVIVSGDSGKLTADSGQKFQLYKKATNPIIHSAVEDNIFYMDDGSPVALCGIPVGDTIDVDLEAYKGQTLTLVSTVAKDPTNLSNDFSMNVRITPNITEIYLMPYGALYWWGSEYNSEDIIAANGWSYSNYSTSSPTRSKNKITMSSPAVGIQGIGAKKAVSGTKAYAVVTGITMNSNDYGNLNVTSTKASMNVSNPAHINTQTMKKYEVAISSNIYPYMFTSYYNACDVFALWYE